MNEERDRVVVVAEPFQQVPGLGLSPSGSAGVAGQTAEQRVVPLVQKGFGDSRWDGGLAGVSGLVGGVVQAVVRLDRSLAPGGVGVGVGRGDGFRSDVRTALVDVSVTVTPETRTAYIALVLEAMCGRAPSAGHSTP